MVAGKLVKLACQRHLRDLELGAERGLVWRADAAQFRIGFYPRFLRHSKGEWARKPVELSPWQKFIIGSLFGWKRADGTRRFRSAYLEVSRKNGKALAVDTLVPTPTGWKRHGDLRPGDRVFDRDGRPVAVLAASEHYDGPCYAVSFSDGGEIIAHAAHEWDTRRKWYTGKPNGKRGPLPLIETQRIAETLRCGARGDLVHSIGCPTVLACASADLLVPPYSLGAWLGDGNSASAYLTAADMEVVEGIRAEGVAVAKSKAKYRWRLSFGKKWNMTDGFAKRLREIGVLNAKHIPSAYLRAEERQRRDLLAGLFDTDGHVTKAGQCEFVTVSANLRDGMLELLRTVGIKALLTEDRASIDGRDCGPRYRIQFWATAEQMPLRIARKRDRLRKSIGENRRSRSRQVTDCQPIGTRTVNCIQVDGGFYLVGKNMMPTHNSTLLAGVGLDMLVCDGEPGAEIYAAAPLALDTRVPTADGWRTMGTLRVGDRVFDENGSQCSVTYLSPIIEGRPCYRLSFSDGTTVVSDGDHRWVTDAIERRSREGRQIGRSAVRTTREISETVRTRRGRPNHRVHSAGALQCDDVDLPIPPYTLGAWLGDGSSRGGKIVGAQSDEAIVDMVRADGFAISDHGKGKLREFTVLGLRTLLRKAALLRNKHVPEVYMRASIEQRLQLLRGLMDTDGTCTKTGECRFTNRNDRLALAVRDLARGLGLRTRMREISVAGAPHYVVSFKASGSLSVFGLPRKAQRISAEKSETLAWRQIVSVDPVESVPVRCISVDSASHLYLVTDGLVPTHNTKKDQARIIFDEAKRMVASSPALSAELARFKSNISVDGTASKFEPLSSDEKTLDGLNPHGVLIDELHKHKTRALLDVLDTALGARRQPLLIIITTAGDDSPESVYAQENDYATKVLEGTIEDDATFAYIATIDKGDNWADPAVWEKANPNLGISVKLDDLERQAKKAAKSPSAQSAFKRLRLNVRTSSAERAIDMEVWAKNGGPWIDPSELRGRQCWGGLDLSSKIDISAWVKLFEPDEPGGRLLVVPRFWMPLDTLEARAEKDRVPYREWFEKGFIEVTHGNVIDHDAIERAVLEDSAEYSIQSVAYDPWNATQLAASLLGKGVPMVEFVQGLRSYSEPTKELINLLVDTKLDHGDNPVLRWMASNLKTHRDKNENLMPHKLHSTGRIDGITGLIMAIGRRMTSDQPATSIYDRPGVWGDDDVAL